MSQESSSFSVGLSFGTAKYKAGINVSHYSNRMHYHLSEKAQVSGFSYRRWPSFKLLSYPPELLTINPGLLRTLTMLNVSSTVNKVLRAVALGRNAGA